MALMRMFVYGVMLVVFSVCAVAQNGTGETQKQWKMANEYMQDKEWEKAADVYQQIIYSDAKNASAWFLLGYVQHMVKKYEAAIVSYQKSEEYGAGPIALYNIACSYAKLSKKEKALEFLTKAAEKGFAQLQTVRNDEDLAALHSEKAFQKAVEMIDQNAHPCAHTAEYRQLDFWQGEWNVVTAQGNPAGKSTIQIVEDGCVVSEHFRWGEFSGRSFSSYNKNTKKWQQLWLDNTGGVMEFTGVYSDKKLVFQGAGYTPDGTAIERRMTLSAAGADKVHQVIEVSTDKGAHWKTMYDLTYNRVDATQAQK